jgi:excisionase family DNA binding protein
MTEHTPIAPKALEPLLTVPQVAEALSMSRRYIELAIARHDLVAVHFGRAVRIAAADLARFVEARRGKPADTPPAEGASDA